MVTHFDLVADNISNFYKSKMAEGHHFEKEKVKSPQLSNGLTDRYEIRYNDAF